MRIHIMRREEGEEARRSTHGKLGVLSFKMHTWAQCMKVLGDGGARRIICESKNNASLSGGGGTGWY
jgi:hypothetical protein